MRKMTMVALAVSVLLVFGTLGLAGFASAYDKEKDHKNDKKITYVALGILGDVTLSCPSAGFDYINVTGGPSIHQPVRINEAGDGNPRVCVGGAVGDLPEQETTAWDVWITDYVWDLLDKVLTSTLNTVDSAGGWDIDFKTAGFARMDLQYQFNETGKGGSGASSGCTPAPDPDDPTACIQDGVGAYTATRMMNNFGFCGQGYLGDDYVDPWGVGGIDDPNAPGNDPGDVIIEESKTVTKTVFVDGLAFFQFDCPLTPGGSASLFNQITGYLNEGSDPGGPVPPGILPPLPDGTCAPGGPLPFLACISPVPPTDSRCYSKGQGSDPKHQGIGTVGVVGTIGWSHEEAGKCQEQMYHADWVTFYPGVNIVVKNAPPSPVTIE